MNSNINKHLRLFRDKGRCVTVAHGDLSLTG